MELRQKPVPVERIVEVVPPVREEPSVLDSIVDFFRVPSRSEHTATDQRRVVPKSKGIPEALRVGQPATVPAVNPHPPTVPVMGVGDTVPETRVLVDNPAIRKGIQRDLDETADRRLREEAAIAENVKLLEAGDTSVIPKIEDSKRAIEEAAAKDKVVEKEIEQLDIQKKAMDEEAEAQRLAEINEQLKTATDPQVKEALEKAKAEIEGDTTARNPHETEEEKVERDRAFEAAKAATEEADAATIGAQVKLSDSQRAANEEAIKKDPKGFMKGVSWISDLMGVENKDWLRAAVYYAGSRAAGTGHGDAMGFAFGAAMTTVENRDKLRTKMLADAKYTPKSIDMFMKTKKAEDLRPVGTKENLDKINFTDPKYVMSSSGEEVAVYPQTLPNGSKRFVYDTGKEGIKPYIGPVEDEPLKVRNEKIINENTGEVASMIEDHYKSLDDDTKKLKPNMANPKTQAGPVMSTIVDQFRINNIPVTKDNIATVMGVALAASANDPRSKGDILTYLDQGISDFKALDYSTSFVKPDGKPIPAKEKVEIYDDLARISPVENKALRQTDIEMKLSSLHKAYMGNTEEQVARRLKYEEKAKKLGNTTGFVLYTKGWIESQR